MNNPLGQFSPATIWVGSHYWVIFHLRAMFARVKTRVRHVFLGNGGRVTEQVIVPTTGVPIFFYNSIKKRRQSMSDARNNAFLGGQILWPCTGCSCMRRKSGTNEIVDEVASPPAPMLVDRTNIDFEC